jgi:hypothetical protein
MLYNVVTGVQTCALPISQNPKTPSQLLWFKVNYNSKIMENIYMQADLLRVYKAIIEST